MMTFCQRIPASSPTAQSRCDNISPVAMSSSSSSASSRSDSQSVPVLRAGLAALGLWIAFAGFACYAAS